MQSQQNQNPFAIHGQVRPGFEAVREAFTDNLLKRQELGGACCAYVHGEKVVDLWGGIRNKRTAEPGSRTRWWSFTRPRRVWPR